MLPRALHGASGPLGTALLCGSEGKFQDGRHANFGFCIRISVTKKAIFICRSSRQSKASHPRPTGTTDGLRFTKHMGVMSMVREWNNFFLGRGDLR